jgi:cytochrome b6-f complex iron-sulfur subunit
MNRREFLTWVGIGGLATSLPIALAACQGSPSDNADAPASSSPREDGFVAVGTITTLDDKGFIFDKQFDPESVLVVRDPANADALVAVGAVCPHEGCDVEWDRQEQFTCPCHNSIFALDGTVVQGPANKPLPLFEAKIEGNDILVKA